MIYRKEKKIYYEREKKNSYDSPIIFRSGFKFSFVRALNAIHALSAEGVL